jgi:hypothetical protein
MSVIENERRQKRVSSKMRLIKNESSSKTSLVKNECRQKWVSEALVKTSLKELASRDKLGSARVGRLGWALLGSGGVRLGLKCFKRKQ